MIRRDGYLPAERIANAVDEPPPTVLVESLQVAATVIGVALLEHIADNLAFVGLFVPEVPLELVFDVVRVEEVDQLANLIARDCDAGVGLWIPPWHFRVVIVLDEDCVAAEQAALETSGVADCSAEVVIIAEYQGRTWTFCRAVELADRADVETVLELLPDVGTHAVAERHADGMGLVVWRGRTGDHVAAHLTDVLHDGGARLGALFHLRSWRELGTENDGATWAKRLTNTEQ